MKTEGKLYLKFGEQNSSTLQLDDDVKLLFWPSSTAARRRASWAALIRTGIYLTSGGRRRGS